MVHVPVPMCIITLQHSFNRSKQVIVKNV